MLDILLKSQEELSQIRPKENEPKIKIPILETWREQVINKGKDTTFSAAPWCGPSCWGDPGNTARSRPAHHRASGLAVDSCTHTQIHTHTHTHVHTRPHTHSGTQKPLSTTASVAWFPENIPNPLGCKEFIVNSMFVFACARLCECVHVCVCALTSAWSCREQSC